jgi:general secretion pathway protein C
VDKALSDINNILTQARAVPNFENGVASGYKLFQIVPGSIYDKLGLQNGDVITGLNGEPINDPGKAFEMMSQLKTSNHLELQVRKEGKPASTYTYDIH